MGGASKVSGHGLLYVSLGRAQDPNPPPGVSQ